MDIERETGVTEGRFTLTLVICALTAIGFAIVLRLAGTSNSTVEVRTNPGTTAPLISPPDDRPNVVPLDVPHSAKRTGSDRK